MPDIVVYGEGNSTVPVNLFKSYFPFVMAFLAVHSHHRIECRTIPETQFFSVLNALLKMFVPVDQKISAPVPGAVLRRKAGQKASVSQ